MPRNYQSDDVLVLLPTLNSALDKIELKFKSIDELNLQDLKDAIDQLEGAAEGGSLADLATKNYVDSAVSPKADSVTVNSQLSQKVDQEKYDEEIAKKADASKFDDYTTTIALMALLAAKVDTDTFTQRLSDKADKSQITGLASESYVDEKVSTIGPIKGNCTKSDLESKKEGAQLGDMYVVTDDDSHIWYYNGTDFIDLGIHYDLSLYETKEEVKKQLATKANQEEFQTLQTEVSDIKSDIGDFNTALEALL